MLLALGFYAKELTHDEIPEELKAGPYIRNQDEVACFYELIDELIEEEEDEQERYKEKKLEM